MGGYSAICTAFVPAWTLQTRDRPLLGGYGSHRAEHATLVLSKRAKGDEGELEEGEERSEGKKC